MSGIAVVGSINLDTSVSLARLPGPGETVLASSRADRLGGKGANQAIAAARTGVPVAFVGAVGDDAAGRRLRADLQAAGVDTAGLATVAARRTGAAFVFVDAAGENQIVVDPGANDAVTLSPSALAIVDRAAVLVVQCEIPEAVVARAAARAERVVVNLAPYRPHPGLVALADPLVVNEHEAAQLAGPGEDLLAQCRSAIVTLGAAGARIVTREGTTVIPSPAPRAVVDTTGAGDAFVGVLAAGLASGMNLQDSAWSAVRAGSRSVEHAGAGSSYPGFDLARRP